MALPGERAVGEAEQGHVGGRGGGSDEHVPGEWGCGVLEAQEQGVAGAEAEPHPARAQAETCGGGSVVGGMRCINITFTMTNYIWS